MTPVRHATFGRTANGRKGRGTPGANPALPRAARIRRRVSAGTTPRPTCRGCRARRERYTGCPRKQSGNMRHGPEPRPGFILATIARITAGMATGPTKQLGTTFLARRAGASSLAAMVTPTRLAPAASRRTDLGSMTRSEMSLNGPRIAGTTATRARPQTVRLGRAVTVISASNAAVPGAILRTISARRSAAGNPTGTVMSMPAYGLSERSPNEVEIARARRCSEGVDVIINCYPAGRGGATGLASKGACVWSWLDHSAYVGICSAYETKSCRFLSWWPDTAESA